MWNYFTYLGDPGFKIHCHQAATSTLSPLYYKLLPWPLSCMVFPKICLQRSGWCEFLKPFSARRVMPSLELTDRIACQSTLWPHFRSIKWFAWEGNPALLSVLWEKHMVRIGPNVPCLTKVPVCMYICVCIYIYMTNICHICLCPCKCLMSAMQTDKKPQCPSWRSTDKGCRTGEWGDYAVWIENEFPCFHGFDITLLGFSWCSLYISFQPLPQRRK